MVLWTDLSLFRSLIALHRSKFVIVSSHPLSSLCVNLFKYFRVVSVADPINISINCIQWSHSYFPSVLVYCAVLITISLFDPYLSLVRRERVGEKRGHRGGEDGAKVGEGKGRSLDHLMKSAKIKDHSASEEMIFTFLRSFISRV